MNRDDIIRIAREANVIKGYESELFVRFAALVAAVEREACAKVCENAIQQCVDEYNDACQDCAEAIRARGQE